MISNPALQTSSIEADGLEADSPGRQALGAFSYSHSQLGTVIRYIQNQQKHHQKRSFHDEYVGLLNKFDVPFDQRYVFKSI